LAPIGKIGIAEIDARDAMRVNGHEPNLDIVPEHVRSEKHQSRNNIVQPILFSLLVDDSPVVPKDAST
jgi:hypothetical protein